ncbi:hypothetical protein DFJ74DRAFT_706341 [Hyaloraphidium curvatum]|nr:hypothetical protein DFJ74DRAFT_706341 [Hyaloraphidium curvatum]
MLKNIFESFVDAGVDTFTLDGIVTPRFPASLDHLLKVRHLEVGNIGSASAALGLDYAPMLRKTTALRTLIMRGAPALADLENEKHYLDFLRALANINVSKLSLSIGDFPNRPYAASLLLSTVALLGDTIVSFDFHNGHAHDEAFPVLKNALWQLRATTFLDVIDTGLRYRDVKEMLRTAIVVGKEEAALQNLDTLLMRKVSWATTKEREEAENDGKDIEELIKLHKDKVARLFITLVSDWRSKHAPAHTLPRRLLPRLKTIEIDDNGPSEAYDELNTLLRLQQGSLLALPNSTATSRSSSLGSFVTNESQRNESGGSSSDSDDSEASSDGDDSEASSGSGESSESEGKMETED